MPSNYDFVMAGAGCAGLSLTYHLLENPVLCRSRILLIDPQTKTKNDRTWCFWTDQPTPFDPIVSHIWKKIEVKNHQTTLRLPLEKLDYKMIRGVDFYETVRKKIAQFPEVHCLKARIEDIKQQDGSVEITADGQKYNARWCFDSVFRAADFSTAAPSYYYLHQHFKGYHIRTQKPVFDPETVVIFDFRTPQIEGVFFFYILPFSPTEGIVEFTVFSKKLLPKEQYDQHLVEYLAEKLQITDFEILETEWGVIPMTDFYFRRQASPNVMRIGTNGGISRGSTGYTFLRIQKDSAKIVESLQAHGTPFYQSPSQWQFEKMDTLILHLMHQKGEIVSDIFMQMFANNPVERVLRFLENGTNSLENLKIMASVSPLPFLKAIGRVAKQRLMG